MPQYRLTRRKALRLGAGALAATGLAPSLTISAAFADNGIIMGTIPRSGEQIPAVGLGTWQTFMPDSDDEIPVLREVLRLFHQLGGAVVDSSPMYTGAEELTGNLAHELGIGDDFWLATKVWTDGEQSGIDQMQQSMRELRSDHIELMQVHNLRDVAVHLNTLERMKAEGQIRYIGITTSNARQYDEVERLLDDDRIDFLQVNYALSQQESAERVLPKARDRGVATMINRPFGGGELFPRFGNQPLPEWASEIGCMAWSQIFLKFVLSHPAVTCAIPATSNPDHLRENMAAGRGVLPDEGMRRRIAALMD